VSVSGGSRHAYFGGGDNARLATYGRPAGGRLAAAGAVSVVSTFDMTVCQATRKDGQPCGASPVKGTELCVGHTRKVK